jgi:CheY-like chemotaxis protein
MDGLELVRRIRARSFADGGATPAIALTAFARSEERTRSLQAGFQLHIAKPVEQSELVAAIVSLVRFAPRALPGPGAHEPESTPRTA